MIDPPGFDPFSGAGPARAQEPRDAPRPFEVDPDGDDYSERARRKARQEAIEAIGPERFTNRELSRLDFGARLLDLAEDGRVPLLERVKFMAIFAQMLDEFFQVRVSGLEDQVAASVTTPSDDGLRPAEQLRAIRGRVEQLVGRQDRIFLDLLVPELAAAGIRLSDWSSLDDDDRRYLVEVFQREMYPVLTPLAVDPSHPFPYISNLSLNLVVEVGDPTTGERRIARVKVPPVLPRFVVMPDGERVVPLEQVIAAHLDTLFPGMTIGRHDVFRVTRNADLTFEEDTDDLMVAIEMELRQRRFGRAVRLEIASGADPSVRELLATQMQVASDNVYTIDAPIGLDGLWAVYGLDRPELHEDSWTPMTAPPLASAAGEPVDIFAVLRERDVLVHHPYDSFATSVAAFVEQAAEDPDVIGIKQTLYRTSGDSPIVSSLIRAAELGKQVATVVELRARFDEQANIGWAKQLEEAGVHVVYGLVGLKTHSKTCLVVRREEEGIRRYCHIGTGNYNSKTARIYEDLGLLTSDDEIGTDLGDLFNHLTGFSRHTDYRQILVSPVTTRDRVIEFIEEQATAGPAGRIVFKLNGLTDPAVIDSLYGASMAGVPIDLIVRGLCSIRAGIPGLSETIRVRSVVGEFLEHSRIFRFGGDEAWSNDDRWSTADGGATAVPGRPPLRVYIGSSDLMRRNLDRRIEVLTPVHDRRLAARLLEVLDLALADDTNSWELGPDGRWSRVPTTRSLSIQLQLKELAMSRVRRRRDIETRAQPVSPG